MMDQPPRHRFWEAGAAVIGGALFLLLAALLVTLPESVMVAGMNGGRAVPWPIVHRLPWVL